MANGTDKKTYEAAVAAFIKENKPKRQVDMMIYPISLLHHSL